MKEIFNPKVSILIINYNNKKFINKSINSVLGQKYKNYEIIFFDDNSDDDSLEVLKKFKKRNFFLIKNKNKNKNKKNFGSYNQINGYLKALKKSKGEIIFFLDSDDFFHSYKIQKIVNMYNKDLNKKIIMDLPYYKYPNQIIEKRNAIRFFDNYWPQSSPQSCISMRRKFAFQVFKDVNFKKFPNIWLDFRIAVYAKYLDNLFISKEHLTYYRQSISQVSSGFGFFGFNWWNRRLEAHQYIIYFFRVKKITYRVNFDYLITKLVNLFYKILCH